MKEIVKDYDSKADTLEHKQRVMQLVCYAANNLMDRGLNHDNSKLKDPEKSLFDEYTPKLKNVTYGSDAYKEYLKELKPALDHHYAKSKHHPEHYPNKINDMTLFDLLEMFLDWKASSERHHDGNILKSIEINTERFNIDIQLKQVLINTAKELDGK